MPLSDARDKDAGDAGAQERAVNTQTAPDVAPQDHDNGGERREAAQEAVTVTRSTGEPSERPAKKMKRGKYISRACTSCQQRKIKCEGGDPCRQCLAKQLPCQSSVPRANGQQARRYSRTTPDGSQVQTLYSSADNSINHEVLARLDALERHLRVMRPSSPDSARAPLSHLSSADNQLRPSSTKLQNTLESDGQTFAGEMAMPPASKDEKDGVNRTSTASPVMGREHDSPESSSHPPETLLGDRVGGRVRGWFEGILIQHAVITDEQEARYHLQVYMDEIHPMYPFIHPPAVWETFNKMWQYSALCNTTDSVEREHVRVSVALVCFCLALGRCSISSRITDSSGVHSSGWSLYNVGMSLLQDFLETSNSATKSLLMLQVLIIRVLYLFRLDANQKAARVHALTVSVAHTIGVHRQSTLDNMPVFYSQLYSRAWWTIYILDRRLAIESGKPYLIQDGNVDTALPIDLSDDWMTRFALRKETLMTLGHEVAAEVARDISPSSIPYLAAMVRYSRVAGKTWEVLYGVKASTASAFSMVEYVDTALCKLLDTAPKTLKYDPDLPYEVQFSTRLRWQAKQTFLFLTCCTYLRLLIRRPLLPSSSPLSHTEEDDLESSIECASLAARVLTTHQSIKEDNIKYSFALSHYVTSCTMVMIGLVSREPVSKRRYGALLLAATQSLIEYCHKIWVSGKMMRCVARLNRRVQSALTIKAYESQDRPGPSSSTRRESVSEHVSQQPTPQAEDQDPRQFQLRTGTSTIFFGPLNELPVDSGGGAQRSQGSDGYSYTSDPSSSMADFSAASPNQGHRLSTPWMTGRGVDGRNSWVMSDFNFETFGERFGHNDANLSALLDNERLEGGRAASSSMDRESGEGRLGLLGMNDILNLDVDLDSTMMNLYDASSMDLGI